MICTQGESATCGASLQSWSVCRHHPRVSGLAGLSDSNLERTTRDVTSIELHINQIETILSGDEPDCIFIYQTEGRSVCNTSHQLSKCFDWVRVGFPEVTLVNLSDAALLQRS